MAVVLHSHTWRRWGSMFWLVLIKFHRVKWRDQRLLSQQHSGILLLESEQEKHLCSISPNHRILTVQRDLWRSSNWTPRQGRLTWGRWHRNAHRGVWMSPERLHNLSGQLFQCSATLNIKSFLFMLRWNFFCFCVFSVSVDPVCLQMWGREPQPPLPCSKTDRPLYSLGSSWCVIILYKAEQGQLA